jgi:hypothetical protein
MNQILRQSKKYNKQQAWQKIEQNEPTKQASI